MVVTGKKWGLGAAFKSAVCANVPAVTVTHFRQFLARHFTALTAATIKEQCPIKIQRFARCLDFIQGKINGSGQHIFGAFGNASDINQLCAFLKCARELFTRRVSI